jgi:polysaccharide biosynthesis protein PslG
MVVCWPMMTNHSLKLRSIVLLIVSLIGLGACIPGEPILVFITPTPSVPTASPTSTSTLPPLPTVTQGESVTDLPTREPVVVGPVVGPGYTLQPSNTPRPTRTPLPTVPPRDVATREPQPPAEATAGPSPTPPPQLNRDDVGIQLYTNLTREQWDQSLNETNFLNVGWIKVQFNWAFYQPQGPDPNFPLFREFEILMETAANNTDKKILLSIAKAPQWTHPGQQGEDAPPDDPQALADLINLMFTQSKIGQSIDAIEVWNEPNLRREWDTQTHPFSGAGYMRLFDAAYRAVRAHSSTVTLVTAGLAPTETLGNPPFSINDRDYLQQMYNAGLASNGYTNIAVGAHPYGWANPPDARCCDPSPDRGWDEHPSFFFIETLDATRDIMNRNGHQDVQIWITEFGWGTWANIPSAVPVDSGFLAINTPDDQANYTLRALEIARDRGDIGPVFLWNLNFANEMTVQNGQEIVAYSLLVPDLNQENMPIIRRPLYFLLSNALNSQ